MVGLGIIKVLTGWSGQVLMELRMLDSILVLFGGLWGFLPCTGLQAGAQHPQVFQHHYYFAA